MDYLLVYWGVCKGCLSFCLGFFSPPQIIGTRYFIVIITVACLLAVRSLSLSSGKKRVSYRAVYTLTPLLRVSHHWKVLADRQPRNWVPKSCARGLSNSARRLSVSLWKVA